MKIYLDGEEITFPENSPSKEGVLASVKETLGKKGRLIRSIEVDGAELDEEAFLKEAFELHDLCKKYNVPFFINDNVDIAIRCHAEGIHVGQEDMAAAQVRQRVGDEMMIGVSVHSVEEALEAVRHGADCLGVGAAFSTHTKEDVDVLPEGMMKAICDAVDIPVVAIGGIHKENLLRLKGTGVNGVALVSAIFGAEDIEAVRRATSELVALVLNPAGTREEFSGQVADAQARLFNAVSALEKGTKNHILIQTRSESNIRMAEYTEILASSKAAGNGSPAEPTPAP